MLVEIYGVQGALDLGDRYPEPFLSLLIDQTIELRRDPDKREKEVATESLNHFLKKKREEEGDIIKTTTPDGREVEIDLSGFALV